MYHQHFIFFKGRLMKKVLLASLFFYFYGGSSLGLSEILYNGESVPWSAAATWDSNGSTIQSSSVSPHTRPNHIRMNLVQKGNYWSAAGYVPKNWNPMDFSTLKSIGFWLKSSSATQLLFQVFDGKTASLPVTIQAVPSYTKFSVPISSLNTNGVNLKTINALVFAISKDGSLTYTVDVDDIETLTCSCVCPCPCPVPTPSPSPVPPTPTPVVPTPSPSPVPIPTPPSPSAGNRESWIWPFNSAVAWSDEFSAIAANSASFTHVSPTFYSMNYPYSSGIVSYVNCPGSAYACTGQGTNNFGTFSNLTGSVSSFNGRTITTQTTVQMFHSLGLKVVPAIYAGAGNGGTDAGVSAILCLTSSTGCPVQTAFISAMVGELVANGYDGYNLDWEMGNGVTSAHSQRFVDFVNALKAAFVKAGASSALVTLDLISPNVVGSWCSGNDGFIDLGLLAKSSIDRIIVEDYPTEWQTRPSQNPGWTAPSSCVQPLQNCYGSASVLDHSHPSGCENSFTAYLTLMCSPNWPDASKIVIGLDASSGGTNPIAGEAFQYINSYGYTKVAVWPDEWPFMSTKSIVPSSANWYSLLKGFLQQGNLSKKMVKEKEVKVKKKKK